MKTLLLSLVVAGLTLPMVACETVHHSESTKKNWDGSVTRDRTTVTENKITGETEVEKAKSRY